jgi:hypothetical protein
MPSRKQRRRREKLQRHEYEYVLETEEGEEIVVERPRLDAAGDGKSAKTDGKSAKAAVPRDRRGREVPKPSMGRVLRRTAIFAPLIAVFVWYTSGEEATATKVTTIVTLLLFFIPFSYLVDVLMYRVLSRRQQRAGTSKG